MLKLNHFSSPHLCHVLGKLNPLKQFQRVKNGSFFSQKNTNMTLQKNITIGAAYRRKQQLLNMLLEENTKAFIATANIKSGMHGLVLNCEVGDLAMLLANAVGVNGSVVGIDANHLNIEIAKQHSANANNLEYYLSEEKDSYLNRSYDFVFARSLFSNSMNPIKEAQQVFQYLKTGGLLLLQEMDYLKQYCYPSNFAFTRYLDLYAKLAKKQGADLNIIPQINPLLKTAGFSRVKAAQVSPLFINGLAKSFSSLMLESLAPQLIRQQLVLPAEINALIEELKLFEQQPETILSLPGIYQMQAHKK